MLINKGFSADRIDALGKGDIEPLKDETKETFLVDKLNFKWNEVHEIAEQLEHINSPILTSKLSEFLNHPKFDPHGDPIPDESGVFTKHNSELSLDALN